MCVMAPKFLFRYSIMGRERSWPLHQHLVPNILPLSLSATAQSAYVGVPYMLHGARVQTTRHYIRFTYTVALWQVCGNPVYVSAVRAEMFL